MNEDFLNQYARFVDAVTSDASKDRTAFLNRVNDLYDAGCNVERLITGSIGLLAEAGELGEVTKKILFQGKPYDADNVYHMKRELGDCAFYLITACIAIGVDPYEMIHENIRKLEARYPNGFEVARSETRKPEDI